MIENLKKPVEKLIAPLCRLLNQAGFSPNTITWIGFFISLCSAGSFAFRQYGLAAVFLVAGGIFDLLDGKLARDFGKTTRFGAFLDSVLDRFSEIALAFGILFGFRSTDLYPLASILFFFTVTGALMTSYVRARGEGIGCDTRGGLLQRSERGIIILVCALISPAALLVGGGIIAFFGYLTAAQRIYFVWKNEKLPNGKG